jgi:hypothetical protein
MPMPYKKKVDKKYASKNASTSVGKHIYDATQGISL